MNQSNLQTRVYQIGEHGRRLPGSRQKSSQYRSAVMMVVRIYLEQLVQRNQQFITNILTYSFLLYCWYWYCELNHIPGTL